MFSSISLYPQIKAMPTNQFFHEKTRKSGTRLVESLRQPHFDLVFEDLCQQPSAETMTASASSSSISCPASTAVDEYVDHFLTHCKCCDATELLETIVNARLSLTASSSSESSAVTSSSSILDRLVVVVDWKTLLAAATTSFFGRAAFAILLFLSKEVYRRTYEALETMTTTSITKDEALVMWRNQIQRVSKDQANCLASPATATPSRRAPTTPQLQSQATIAEEAGSSSLSVRFESPRAFRNTPRRIPAASVTPKR